VGSNPITRAKHEEVQMGATLIPKLFWVLVFTTPGGQQMQTEPMISEACLLTMFSKYDNGYRNVYCIDTRNGKRMFPTPPQH
jgi:hypothetical protein